MLIYCIHLLCDWSFRLCHHIIYISYFVTSCLFLLWHNPYGVFCAAIKRDSVSLNRFLFLSHVQVFSREISLMCRLKCPYSCFSFHFSFLVIFDLLMLGVVCIVSCHCNQSSFVLFYVVFSSGINAWTLSWMLTSPSSFLDTYSLSTSSLRCKVLCIVTSFLVLWSICWSSFQVHFKNGRRGTTRVFIYSMRFLLCSLISSSFLVLLRYSFKILSFIYACLVDFVSNIPKHL